MADDAIETSFQAAIDSGKINGAVICATDAEGRFVYENALGKRTLLSGERKPEQMDDVLFLASATKFMTTVAALTCVDDGLLSLEGDLPTTVYPELAEKQILTGFTEHGNTPRLEPRKHPITLEMLLTHSSGLTYFFMDPNIAKWRELTRGTAQDAIDTTRRRTVDELYDYPLIFQPGMDWMYGTGLDFAGRAVEIVTGQTLGERMHERMFKPLGITDAQFAPVTRKDLRARMVDLNPNDPDGMGRAVVSGMDMNATTKGDFGGHGLFMTAPDYLKVLQSLLANDGKILKPATVDNIFQPHLNSEATVKHKARMADANFGPPIRCGVPQGVEAGYGLGGLLTLEDVEGWYGERTLTWGGGLTFTWFIDRKNDLCGVGAVQGTMDSERNVLDDLKDTFRHDIYRKHVSWKKSKARI